MALHLSDPAHTQVVANSLPAIVAAGGDTGAYLGGTSVSNPATRGSHMLVRYMAPMQRFHEEWGGRVHRAMLRYAVDLRGRLLTHKDTIGVIMGECAAYVPAAWDTVGDSLLGHNQFAGDPDGLPDADRRFRLQHALSRVAVATAAAALGDSMHKVDFADARNLRDKALGVFAAQGTTAVDLLGEAINFSGQVVSARAAHRSYLQSVAKFKSEQYVADAEDRANRDRDSGIGGGILSGLIGSFF